MHQHTAKTEHRGRRIIRITKRGADEEYFCPLAPNEDKARRDDLKK